MLAGRLHAIEDLRRDEIDEPEPGPDEVKLRVSHNGLCGTDLAYFYERGPRTTGPQPIGHEFSGVITEVGAGVPAARVGERVCVCAILHCGSCAECTAGLTNLCTGIDVAGIGCGADRGGLAEFVVVPSELAITLSPGLSLAEGALVEPMAVAFNGVMRSGIEPGGTAVVLGGGPIGIGVLLGLRAIDVDRVLVVEPAAPRRKIVEALGARAVDPMSQDVTRAAAGSSPGGRGADAVFVCAGPPDIYLSAVPLARPRGRVVEIATFRHPVLFSPTDLLRGEIEIVAARAYTPALFTQVIEIMDRGGYPTAGWVEHVPWAGIVEHALEPLRRGERMKLLVDVTP